MSHRVVAALLVRSGAVLLCHRRADRRWYPDCWDLPGGHVEEGESARDALVRECREELGIAVLDAVPVPVASPDPTISLTLFAVTSSDGEPANTAPDEHDAVGWFRAGELAALRLADPAYRSVLADALSAWGTGRPTDR